MKKYIVSLFVALSTSLCFGQTVTSPKAGDVWYEGETNIIRWVRKEGYGDSIWIQLLSSAGTKTLAIAYPNTGSFVWKTERGSSLGTNFVIRVYYSPGVGWSDAPVIILPGTRPPTAAPQLPQPALSVKKIIAVNWKSETNAYYQIKKSVGLDQWEVVEDLIIGNGEEMQYSAPAETGKEFFSVSRLSSRPDLSGRTLNDPYFKSMDLIGASFREGQLIVGNFEKADLTSADFTKCTSTSSNFKGAWLINSVFTDAVVFFGDFEAADLAGTNVDGAVFAFCNFTGARLPALGTSKFIWCRMPDGTLRNDN